MRAAVVTHFDRPPTARDHPDPVARHADEEVVSVVAAGLHPRVRSQAAGSHDTSTGVLPLVPGIDGVGRTAIGELRYFALSDPTMGSMAERTVIDLRRSIALPADADPVVIAAAMNPAMASWVALRRRIVPPGEAHVMVLGATGSAGRMAVAVARHLGVARVTAVGRSAPALRAIVPRRTDDQQTLTWVQIGSVAGPEAPIPSAALRATRLELVGSGQGSVPARAIVEELPALVAEIARGTFPVAARPVPLADVTTAWTTPRSTDRLVIVP